MKIRFYAILFLSVLVLYILRPIIPFIEYALNKDYIAKNLCVNRDKPKSCCEGKCHLKKELQKSDTSENDAKDNTKKLQQKQISEFLKSQAYRFQMNGLHINYCIFPEPGIQSNTIASIFVPPKRQSKI